jgi:hypothetical protein
MSGFLYLPQSALPVAQVRSQQQASALGCDGVQTRYWWAVASYVAPDALGNNAAVVIYPGTPFDVTTANLKVINPVGLTAQEQAALQTAQQVAPLLPPDTPNGTAPVGSANVLD